MFYRHIRKILVFHWYRWMSVVDDGSDEGEGLFHEVGLAIVRQIEALVSKCVEATQSTLHAVKGSAKTWATFSATLLQNVTTDMTDTFSTLCCFGISHGYMRHLLNSYVTIIMRVR